MDKKMKGLFKNTLIFAIGNFGSKIILFILVPLYTNYMSRDDYGSADFVFTMSQLLYPVVSLCVYEGLIRIGLKKGMSKENTLICALAVWVGSCAVLAATTPLWSFYGAVAEWKWFLSLHTAIHILCEIELDYLKVKEKNKLFAVACIVQTLTLAGLNIYLIAYLRVGVIGYLVSNVSALFVEAVFIFFIGRLGPDIKKGKFSLDLLKMMLTYSVPLILNNISWWVIHSSDKIMIEALLTTSALGLYTVATKIPSLINVFINIFSQSWGISSIKEMEAENDSGFYSDVFVLYSTLVIGFAILVIAIAKPFMTIYVGADFVVSWHYVPLLIVSAVFSSLAAYFASLMGALQISKKTMITTLAGAIVNIVFNFIFILVVGVWGAVIGTVCAYVVIAVTRALITTNRITINIPKKTVVINLSTVVIQALLVSLEFYIYMVSAVAIVIFVLNNRKSLKRAIVSVKKILKKRPQQIEEKK